MRAEHHHHGAPTAGGAIDPVCGMSVDPATAKHKADYQGATYYFCCNDCRTKFAADPQKFLKKREPEPVIAGAIYTCPMHPQIRQVGPGACPICGMALEPEMPSAATGANPELVDMTRRFWIGLALAVPVMAVEMSGHFGAHWFAPAVVQLDSIRLCNTRGAVGRLAVLRARRAIARHPQSQHVHAHRHGHGRCLRLQRRRHAGARHLPRSVPRSRSASRLFRSCQHDHRAGAHRAGAGTARARGDLRRHPRVARSGAENRAPRQGRRWRRRYFARSGPCRRPLARPPRRQGAGGRHRTGRPLLAR